MDTSFEAHLCNIFVKHPVVLFCQITFLIADKLGHKKVKSLLGQPELRVPTLSSSKAPYPPPLTICSPGVILKFSVSAPSPPPNPMLCLHLSFSLYFLHSFSGSCEFWGGTFLNRFPLKSLRNSNNCSLIISGCVGRCRCPHFSFS